MISQLLDAINNLMDLKLIDKILGEEKLQILKILSSMKSSKKFQIRMNLSK